MFKLFFDDASKGNLGKAGGGGVIFVSREILKWNIIGILDLTPITWLKSMGCGKELSS